MASEEHEEQSQRGKHHEAIVESMADSAFVVDSDWQLEFANEAALSEAEMSLEAIEGTPVVDLIEEIVVEDEDLEKFRRALETVYADDTDTDYPVVVELDMADGNSTSEYHCSPQSTGEETKAVVVARDITDRKERVRELQENQKQYERLFETVPVAVGVNSLGERGEFEFVNQTAVEMFDATSKEELEQYSPGDFYAEPAEREQFAERLKEQGTVEQYETEFTTLDGDHLEVSITAELTELGGEQRIVGIVEDISERKRQERELEEKQERLQGLFDDAPDPIFVQDGKGRFTDVNQKAAEKLGYTREELLEMEAADIDAAVSRADAEELLSMVESEDRMVEIQGRHQRADGSTYPVDVRVTPLETDGQDRFLSHARDVTERKEREAELERKQEFLEQTQEVADIGGWEVDLRSDSLRWTDEVYHIHGLDLDFEPTVEGAIDLYHPEDQATIQDAVERATTEGEPYDLEVRIVRPDGEVRWTRALGEPWYEDGEIVGARGTFQDITDRKEREEQLKESNERLEQFAYVASHDLQEPLRTISNYTEILAEDYVEDLDEEAQRFIDIVVTGSDRMQSMINGLLDYSRVTTRGGEFEPVDTEQVVVDTIEDLHFMLAEHDGTVETGDMPTVEADGDQLHQVFQNLVKNALEHAGDDAVNIDIQASEEASQYRFEVEDDGSGIAENRQEKIFRIFKSGEQYQTASQAKGLGLAICDNIVRRHGGDIWVESEPGDGATFVFTIDKNKQDGNEWTNDE